LSSSTPRLARQAAAALARIGPAAIPALTDALNEEDAALNACFALGLIGQPAAEAAPALLHFLAIQQVAEDGHCHPCAAAVFALNELGPNTTAGLLELAASTNLTASRYAAAALGQRASDAEALVPALAGLLSDTNWHVRAGASMAIGDLAIKTNVVVDATLRSSLEIASTNANPRTALPAAAALHLLDRGENANPVLTRFLAHSEARVRLAAVSAIGRATSAPPAMVDALLESLFDREGKVRARTVQILPKFAASHPKIVNALRDSLGDPHARNDAALALGAIGSAALPGLITDTKDNDPQVRDWAVFAIGHMRPTPEAGVWAVAAALNDAAVGVRETAA
jgi:HEAT repeat protein